MMSILVMGGSRFIGKHLLNELAKDADNEILVINRGSIPNEMYLPAGATQISLDRNDRDAMKNALSGRQIDLVFDVSGITADHSQILVDSLDQPPKRHIYVSSGAVYNMYGDDPPVYSLPIDEDFEIGPINENEHPYMNNKRGGEKVLFDAYNSSGYPTIIVRPTFVYGPDNYIYREAYFFDRIHHDRPVLLPNNGHAFMDLVYVEDLARLLVLVSTLPLDKVIGQAYNGTKGDAITQQMYAKLAGKIIGKKPELLYFDPTELTEMKWPVQKFFYPYVAEGGNYQGSRKIEHELGFTDSVTYEVGLTKSYEWWQEHGQKRDDFELENALITYIRAKGTEDGPSKKQELQELVDKINKEIEEQKANQPA